MMQKLKSDYTSREQLVVDVLALVYRDMTYSRELLLPDVSHPPLSELPETLTHTESASADGVQPDNLTSPVCNAHSLCI